MLPIRRIAVISALLSGVFTVQVHVKAKGQMDSTLFVQISSEWRVSLIRRHVFEDLKSRHR